MGSSLPTDVDRPKSGVAESLKLISLNAQIGEQIGQLSHFMRGLVVKYLMDLVGNHPIVSTRRDCQRPARSIVGQHERMKRRPESRFGLSLLDFSLRLRQSESA